MREYDLIVVGGGPAGMAAAAAARENGVKDILVLERDEELGGVLNQCIHNGFGLHNFGEELTGPEYAARYIEIMKNKDIPFETNTTVLDITNDKKVTVISSERGVEELKAKAVILAMGCRERPRGALNIPGYRPQGVYTAGTVQRLVNMKGFVPGKKAVILGSGDIGLIMARRLTLEGTKVEAVAELMPYSSGLKRNIVQCLDDFGIPLLLSHTVTKINGKHRLESVVISEVDEKGTPIEGTQQTYECDTLLLSCGLLPENELSRNCGIELSGVTNGAVVNDRLETSIPGVFACGNVLHVHDLVDFVSEEAARAGENAAEFIANGGKTGKYIPVAPGNGIRYTVPSKIDVSDTAGDVHIRFRTLGVFKGARLVVSCGERELYNKKKQIMVPSEMIDVTLDKKELSGLDGTVSVFIKEQ